MSLSRIHLVVPCALALTSFMSGCAAQVDGTVDDAAVDMILSAFFTQTETDIGEDTLVSVSGVGVSTFDGCNAAARAQENTNEAFDQQVSDLKDAEDQDDIDDANDTFAQAIVDYEVANFPTDYWTVSIGVSALDDGDIDGAESDIDIEDAEVSDQDVNSSAGLCRTNDHPDVKDHAVDRDADCYGTIKGTVEVLKWDDEVTFQAVADVTVGEIDDDGIDPDKDVGDLVIQINGSFCQPLQDAVEEFNDLVQDAIDDAAP